jgi:hypothetical protein
VRPPAPWACPPRTWTPSRDVVVRKAVRPPNSQLTPDKIRALGYTRFTDVARVVQIVMAELGGR